MQWERHVEDTAISGDCAVGRLNLAVRGCDLAARSNLSACSAVDATALPTFSYLW